MPILTPQVFDKRTQYEDERWVKKECYRFYVQQRRIHCAFTELMDLWLPTPYCEDCIQSDPFGFQKQPDIRPDTWEEDLLFVAGGATFMRTQLELAKDPDYAFQCKRCNRNLRPWRGHEVYVVEYHLEERYSIPLETPGRIWPDEKLRREIVALYGFSCFGCGLSEAELEEKLCIDHVRPRALGGDAAFRNLQPLCHGCGQRKGAIAPDEVAVYSPIYFGATPSDAYEGLFW